jgi:hypothetical protein
MEIRLSESEVRVLQRIKESQPCGWISIKDKIKDSDLAEFLLGILATILRGLYCDYSLIEPSTESKSQESYSPDFVKDDIMTCATMWVITKKGEDYLK